MIQIIIGAIIFLVLFMYAIVYGAAETRSPEYQAWLDDEQMEALKAMRDK